MLGVEAGHESAPYEVASMTTTPPPDMPGHRPGKVARLWCPTHKLLLLPLQGTLLCPQDRHPVDVETALRSDPEDGNYGERQ